MLMWLLKMEPSSSLLWLLTGIMIGLLPSVLILGLFALDNRAHKQRQKSKVDEALPLMPASHVRAFEHTLRGMLAWKQEHDELPDDLYVFEPFKISEVQQKLMFRRDVNAVISDRASDLGALLQAVIRDLPHPLLTPTKASLWTDAALNAESDPRESTRILIRVISDLPPQYRHVLLLLLRHLRSVVDDLSSEEGGRVIESWSRVLWPDEPSGLASGQAGRRVVECLLSQLLELLGAFALTEKEREVYHGIQTHESRRMLYDLLPDFVEQCVENEETARLVSAFGSRWFAEFFDDKELRDKITNGVNRNLTQEEFPTWLKSIRIHSLSLGGNFPSLKKARLYPTRVGKGELAASIWVDLHDGPRVIVDVEVAIPKTGIRLIVSLKVQVKTFCGRFWLFLPSPFEDPGFGWASIEGVPALAFKTEITVGSLPAKYLSLVCSFVEGKLREGFLQEWTLPQWKRLEMPWVQPKMKEDLDWAVEAGLGKNSGLLYVPYKAGSAVSSRRRSSAGAMGQTSAVAIGGSTPPRLVPITHKIPPVQQLLRKISSPHGGSEEDLLTWSNTVKVAKTMAENDKKLKAKPRGSIDGFELQEYSREETHSLTATGETVLVHNKSRRGSHRASYDPSIVLADETAKISPKTSPPT